MKRLYNISLFMEMSTKNRLGQFYTENYECIFQGLTLLDIGAEHANPRLPIRVVEPFAGRGDILEFVLKDTKGLNATIEAYDIEPKSASIQTRDTLLNPPDYADCVVATNPPFLARNKTKQNSPYSSMFESLGCNDLYKCFLHSLIKARPIGGILILPINFWSSVRLQDRELRRVFLSGFRVIRMNVFEYRVFADTAYNVCAFVFERSAEPLVEQSVMLRRFRSAASHPESYTIKFNKKNQYTIGGEITLSAHGRKKNISRWVGSKASMPPDLTNMLVKCIDDTRPISMRVVQDSERYCDETPNRSARSYATLCMSPRPSIKAQTELATKFNDFIDRMRSEYASLFLPSYRENGRKRIPFDMVYTITALML